MNNKLEIIFQQDSSKKKNRKIEEITKKILKIEKLQVDFEILKTKIKTIKEQVDEQSATAKQHFCKAKEQYTIMLIGKFELKGLTRWQKDILTEMINEEYQILTNFDYQSEELNDAFAHYIKMLNNNMSSYEEQFAKESFAEMMSEFGLDDDMEFDFSKMNDPKYKKQFEEKIREQQQKIKEEQKAREKVKQVSKTDIDFQKIYKKLCKIAHPDLYKNESEKAVKEEQMQRLTKIWEERNYYELLMIWLEIDPENSIELQITDANQKNIIKQLNNKIISLESEIYRSKFFYKDSAFYYENFNAPNPKTVAKKINGYIKTLSENAIETAKEHEKFAKTANLKKHFAKVNDAYRDDEFGDFLTNFGSRFD